MNKMSRYERLYREALRIRRRHGPDPKKALEGEGVTLIPMNTSTRLLGMYKVILRNPFVFYNDSVDEAVQRMVFATNWATICSIVISQKTRNSWNTLSFI